MSYGKNYPENSNSGELIKAAEDWNGDRDDAVRAVMAMTSDTGPVVVGLDKPVFEAKLNPANGTIVTIDQVSRNNDILHTIEEHEADFGSTTFGSRGIVIEASESSGEIAVNLAEAFKVNGMDVEVKAKKENTFNLQEQSLTFMRMKDKEKFNLKEFLKQCFPVRHKEKRIPFVKDLYSLKLVGKSFKNLNLATKRILIADRFRKKLLIYSQSSGVSTIDMLIKLDSDISHVDFFVGLIKLIPDMLDKGIEI